jgi:membrane-associated phospholipid phosphatase
LPAIPVVAVWGLVIWSRTRLRQHSLSQAIAGVVLGILITLPTYALVYNV